MSTPSNTAKLGVTHSNIQTALSSPSLVGSESALVSILLSQLIYPLCHFWLALLCLGSERWFSCSLGCTLSCVGWGRLVAIVAFRSGLYLGRSLSESYKHSKWLFRRTSWCLWRLSILNLLSESLNAWNDFSALLFLWLGSFGRRTGTLSAPVCWGLLFTSRCTSPTPPPRGACWAPKEFFLWVANGALAFSSCLVVSPFRQRLRE